MQHDFGRFQVRPLELADAPSFTRHLNNIKVSRNLRHPPFPFTEADAVAFIERTDTPDAMSRAAIVLDSEAVGVLGYRIGEKTECRTATIGYWLGEDFWGQGIMTEAVRWLVEELWAKPEVLRIEGDVFGWNPASGRVLEKAGLVYEATLRQAVWKFEEATDLLIYARVKG